MEEFDILTRNTAEMMPEDGDEIRELLDSDENPRAYVGYETSGPVHLGHWISVRKLLDAQDAGIEPVVLLADFHTYINEKGGDDWSDEKRWDWIEDMTEYWETTFDALGLEADYVRGTEFQLEEDYVMDVFQGAIDTTQNRAERAMGEVSEGENPSVAQHVYPIMQSLDIPYLDVDLAVGGTDQRKIHALARDMLPDLGYDSPAAMHYPLLPSLKGKGEKMSSSKPNTMFALHEDPGSVEKKIKQAYCPEGELEGNPITDISRYFVFGADEELEIERPEEYGGDITYSDWERMKEDYASGELHPADLKPAVSSFVTERLEPVRERFKDEPELLDPLEDIGGQKPEYVEE